MDIDARTAKRVADVQHIKSKQYYKPVIEEPDPYIENCSTRKWRFTMRTWVLVLKKNAKTCDRGLPQHEGSAPDVMTGSQ